MSGAQAALPPDPRNPGTRLLGLQRHRLVLASSSPRREDLLRALGVPFRSQPVSVDETMRAGESPEAACVRLARTKALGAATPGDPDLLVLGADTLVVLDGSALGKPRSHREAGEMLRRLSGRSHHVLTGLAVHRTRDGSTFTGMERTEVHFGVLSEEVIDILVASGEPLDKAGAYAIQGLAGLFVERIDGDYFNVVGLPLARLRRLMQEAS
jgi:nucleoside triphosphate pyrophosphatase